MGDRPRPTILLVDDDPLVAALAQDALALEGYRVVLVHNHAQALVAIAAVRFRLVLTDTGAGAVPGSPTMWADLGRIREAAGTTPTVLFSAHHPTLLAGHHERGFAGVIAKPFDLDALLETVRRLIDRDWAAA